MAATAFQDRCLQPLGHPSFKAIQKATQIAPKKPLDRRVWHRFDWRVVSSTVIDRQARLIRSRWRLDACGDLPFQ
jgi:hypothetical protein